MKKLFNMMENFAQRLIDIEKLNRQKSEIIIHWRGKQNRTIEYKRKPMKNKELKWKELKSEKQRIKRKTIKRWKTNS